MAGSRPKGSAKRTLLLDTAEKLIVEEGYAAVSTRRVAIEAGLKPPLVHYYFPTTEDLLLAVYERAMELAHQRTLEAFDAVRPLEAFWRLSKESAHTALGTEFFALANHRKLISSAIARHSLEFRSSQAEALSRALGDSLDRTICDPVALVVLVTGISRILVVEEAIGVTEGHAEVRALIDWLLRRVTQGEPAPAAPQDDAP
jgi:AcrR family transcriptional regulator